MGLTVLHMFLSTRGCFLGDMTWFYNKWFGFSDINHLLSLALMCLPFPSHTALTRIVSRALEQDENSIKMSYEADLIE